MQIYHFSYFRPLNKILPFYLSVTSQEVEVGIPTFEYAVD